MNSKQLVTAALNGQPVPRTPIGPLAVHYCAGHAGFTLRQYTTNARVLADSVIRYYERYQPDAIWLSADTWVSAEAMGVKVGSSSDQQPFGALGGPIVSCAADLERIPSPDVGSQGRYPLMLEALSRIIDALGKEVFIVACMDQYPFSLAAALMGINEIMLALYDDPPLVEALLAKCSEFTFAYGRALAMAGADMLSGGDSPAGLVGPTLYEETILYAEKRLLDRLKPAVGIPVSLHICGNSTSILPMMVTSGADVFELDHAVDLAHACRIVGPEIAIWGNLDPVSVMLRGTPELVRQKARSAMAAVQHANHSRFVLSSGCTLAVETPAANIEALIAAECDA